MSTLPSLLSSTETLIRALKAPHDPPFPSGPSKIELATAAWENQSYYLPGKAEVLVEWALGRLLKDRPVEGSGSSISDARFLQLISCILTSNGTASQPRASKAWLPGLLARIPSIPVLTRIFHLYISASPSPSLISAALLSYGVILPYASPKANLDTLLECFGESLRAVIAMNTRNRDTGEKQDTAGDDVQLSRLALLTVSAFRSHLVNATNKKRALSVFLETHVQDWVTALQSLSGDASTLSSNLREELFKVGEDILFGIDALRMYLEAHKNGLATLFSQLEVVPSRHAVLEILPGLLSSYISALRRNPSVLPSSSAYTGHSAALRLATLRFFQPCLALIDASNDLHTWTARLSLLGLIESERAYDIKTQAWKDALLRCVEVSTDCLDSPRPPEVGRSPVLAMEVLSLLIQMDFDLIEHHLERLLRCNVDMTATGEATLAFETFFIHVLDYYSKTRSLHIFLELMTSAISGLAFGSEMVQEEYNRFIISPIYSFRVQDRLETLVFNFLTPGKTLTALRGLNTALSTLMRASTEEAIHLPAHPRKRRKTGTASLNATIGKESAIVRFALLARVAATVYSGLIRWDTSEQMLSDACQCAAALAGEILKPLLDGLASVESTNVASWPIGVRMAALLRLSRVLQSASNLGHNLFPIDARRSIEVSLLPLALSSKMLSELRAESILTVVDDVLRTAESLETHSLQTLDVVLDVLVDAIASLPKNGTVACLANLHAHNPLVSALPRSIGGRCVAVLSRFGTEAQVDRAAKFVLDVLYSNLAVEESLNVNGVLLCDSALWELSRLKDSIARIVREQTSPLEAIDVYAYFDSSVSAIISDSTLNSVIGIYKALLLIPMEYLSRADCLELARRAFAVDVELSKTEGGAMAERSQIILRTYIERTTKQHAPVPVPFAAAVKYLIGQRDDSTASGPFVEAAISLVNVFQLEAIRMSRQNPAAVVDILSTYGTLAPFDGMHQRSFTSGYFVLQGRGLLHLLNLFVQHQPRYVDLPLEVKQHLGDVARQIRVYLDTIDLDSWESLQSQDLYMAVEAWSASLAFTRWTLSQWKSHGFAARAPKIILHTMQMMSQHSNSQAQLICAMLFSGLVDEWTYGSLVESWSCQDQILALYTLLHEQPAFAQSSIHSAFASFCRSLGLTDRQRLLRTVTECLLTSEVAGRVTSRPSSLNALAQLLKEVSPGQDIRPLVTYTLQVLSDRLAQSDHVDLSASVVTFLTSICSDRNTSLSPSDIGYIWTTLCFLLAGSKAHVSRPSIFMDIGVLVTTIIRNRRNLAIGSLSQLSAVLSRLFQALRGPRQSLGARQASVVADSLPMWVNPEDPLGVEEAAALARLLGTLAVKTVVHTASTREDGPKAESLAKPFARHAPYVLKTYLCMLADPLSSITSPMRRELEPGLFVLCTMTGEEGRDALMASLTDATVKALFVALWREYEKQRYMGKG